jgi:hypothetical protein
LNLLFEAGLVPDFGVYFNLISSLIWRILLSRSRFSE